MKACVSCDVRQLTVERLQASLTEALRRMREHADELELQREHNATLFKLLERRDRQIAWMEACAVRATREAVGVRSELERIKAALGESQGADGSDRMDELRRSVAEIIGCDPETWPDHGNAPLAIAAIVALGEKARERLYGKGQHGLPVEQPAQAQGWQAAADVMAERRRQIERKGWTPEHDDEHDSGKLAAAGSAYALAAADHLHPLSHGDGCYDEHAVPMAWPHGWQFKPAEPRRMLVKAAALILAEIERLDRAEPLPAPPSDQGKEGGR